MQRDEVMLIKRYEIEAPDSDGDCCVDLTFEVINDYNSDLMLIKYDIFYLNEDGYLVSSYVRNSSLCFLGRGAAQEINGLGRIHKRYLTKDSSITAQINARLFRAETFKLGTFKSPESEGVLWLDADVDSRMVENKIKISMARLEPSNDGYVRIDAMTQIKNKTNANLEDVGLKVSIFNRAGSEIDNASYEQDLPPFSTSEHFLSLWGVKLKQLKDSNIEFSITTYEHIGTKTIEGTTRFFG